MGLLERAASYASSSLGRGSLVVRALRPTYERLLDVANGGRGTEWSVNGESIRIDPRVRRLVAPETEPELWSWLRANMRPGDRVLDVGSFLGIYAVFLARWGGPSARVLAFEPTPRMCTTLRRHVMINGVGARVRAFNTALGARPGRATLHQHSDPYRNAIGATDPGGRGTGTTDVEVTTIDAVCEYEGFVPTMLRMDVQGFERDILRGARRVIARGRGTLRMVLEVHPQLWPMHGFDEAAFDATLAELGLRAEPLKPGDKLYEPDGHVELKYA